MGVRHITRVIGSVINHSHKGFRQNKSKRYNDMKILSFSLVIGFICSVGAQELSLGKCPNFSVIQNFNPTQYLGKWYEYSNYFAIFQLFSDCVSADYSDISYGGQTKIKVSTKELTRSRAHPTLLRVARFWASPTTPPAQA